MEVCIGGVWGTVCHYRWDSNDARVVCRQLGFEVDVPRRCECPGLENMWWRTGNETRRYAFQHVINKKSYMGFLLPA